MDRELLIEKIKTNTEIDIYYEYLLGQNVWYFQNNSGSQFSSDYDSFKKFISKNLNVPFNNISIVGSAKTRYSFSPQKNLSEFNENSDFDLIIVSRKLFYDMWDVFREISINQNLDSYLKKCKNIFGGFISLRDDDNTYGNDKLIEWQRNILSFKAQLQLTFNIEHDINYRIYSDWKSVEEYHLRGITKLKNIVNETY